MKQNKQKYIDFLERNFFKCTFLQIKKANLFYKLNLTDDEIIIHRKIILEALKNYVKCNDSTKKCANINTHYKFYRKQDHINQELNYEPIKCVKQLDINSLSLSEKEAVAKKYINCLLNDNNFSYKKAWHVYDEFCNGKFKQDHQLISNCKWFSDAIEQKKINLLVAKKTLNPIISQKFIYFCLITLIKKFRKNIIYIDGVQLKKICVRKAIPFFPSSVFEEIDKTQNILQHYKKITTVPILVIDAFDNDMLIKYKTFEAIFQLISQRFLLGLSTIMISFKSWNLIYNALLKHHLNPEPFQKFSTLSKELIIEINSFFIKNIYLQNNELLNKKKN